MSQALFASNRRVLPVRYDDNYFWLLPGESRRIGMSWPSRLGRSQGVQARARAYNSYDG
jgi:hypothetical protein